MRWWLFVLIGCGRIGFDGPDATAERCATATFVNPAASSFNDDFSSGLVTDRWKRNDTCIDQIGGELVATPSSTPEYCFVYTPVAYHLSCDAVTVHVPEVTAPVVGVQTVLYIYDMDSKQQMNVLFEGGGIAFGDPAHAFDYDNVNDAWWRVGEADGTAYFDSSPDGASWQRRMTAPTPFSFDDVQIEIGAGTYKPVATPGRARFHCYNVPPPCN